MLGHLTRKIQRCVQIKSSNFCSNLGSTKFVPSGLLAVHKPIGMTSSDVCNVIKRSLISGFRKTNSEVNPDFDVKKKYNCKVGHGK
jgi:tRNA U55 pseudouridine synthase TruB